MIIRNALMELQGKNLTKRIGFAKYRKIMSYPVWNYVRQAIVSTRAYEDGLNVGHMFLDLTGQLRHGICKPLRDAGFEILPCSLQGIFPVFCSCFFLSE